MRGISSVVINTEIHWSHDRFNQSLGVEIVITIKKTVVYYKSIKRELHRRPIYDCRCDKRLKTNDEGSTRLTYTGLIGGLENRKDEENSSL